MKKSLGILILPLALILAGCQSQTPQADTTSKDGEKTQESAVETQTVEQETSTYQTEYDIDMTNFAFSVSQMQAKPGDTITINLTNSQGIHDLVIDELDAHSEHLDKGQTDTMTITIPENIEPGTEFEYYCSVGNHRQMGMVGTLTIIE